MDGSDKRFIDMLVKAVRGGQSFLALSGPLDASDPCSVKAHLLGGGAMYNALTGEAVVSDDNDMGVLFGFLECRLDPDEARAAWDEERIEPAQLALLSRDEGVEWPPEAIDGLAIMCTGDGWIDGFGPLTADSTDSCMKERGGR